MLPLVLLALLKIPAALAFSSLDALLQEPGALRGSVSYLGAVHSSADVPAQARTLDGHDHELSFRVPVSQSRQSSFLPRLDLGYRSQTSDAVLAGEPIPSALSEITLGADWLRTTTSGNVLGASAGVGVKSDQTVFVPRNLALEAAVFFRRRVTPTSGWALLTQFSNNRGYFNWLPIPGAAYYGAWSDKLRFSLGLPSASLRLTPLKELRIDASFLLFDHLRVQASYGIEEDEAFVVGYRWTYDDYLPNGRSSAAERLIVEEKRAYAGFDARLVGELRLLLLAGIQLDKKLLRTTSLLQDSISEVDLDPALFGSLGLRASF